MARPWLRYVSHPQGDRQVSENDSRVDATEWQVPDSTSSKTLIDGLSVDTAKQVLGWSEASAALPLPETMTSTSFAPMDTWGVLASSKDNSKRALKKETSWERIGLSEETGAQKGSQKIGPEEGVKCEKNWIEFRTDRFAPVTAQSLSSFSLQASPKPRCFSQLVLSSPLQKITFPNSIPIYLYLTHEYYSWIPLGITRSQWVTVGLASVSNAFPVNAGKRPPRNTQALPAKSYAARPSLITPGNALSSWAAVAGGEYPTP